MHKGSEDNLRASPVRAVQAMMASRLKNLLPPMTVKRERLSWYKAIPLSSDPQFEACLIDCDSQTGILWYRTSKERLCGWKVAIWPRRNTISHRFKSEGYLIIIVSTRKIPYKLIVSHCHETLIVSTESLAFRIAFRDGDKRRYYFTCLLLNNSFFCRCHAISSIFPFSLFFFLIYTHRKKRRSIYHAEFRQYTLHKNPLQTLENMGPKAYQLTSQRNVSQAGEPLSLK